MLFPGSQAFSIAVPQPPLFPFYQSWRLYSLPMRKCCYNICCSFFFSFSPQFHFCFLLTPVAHREELFHPAVPTYTEPPDQATTAHLEHGPVTDDLTGPWPACFASLNGRVQIFLPPSSRLLWSGGNIVPGKKPLGFVSNVENAFWMQSSSRKESRQKQRACLIALIRPLEENIKNTQKRHSLRSAVKI